MFNKTYTIVISNENTDEAFRNLMTRLNNYSAVKSIKENKESGWIVIRLKTSVTKWKLLLGKLKKDMKLELYKIGEYWFI